MSAQDYTVDASAAGCCRGAHVWDSPDGFVPEHGRQVTCRVCPATARAKVRLGRTPEQEKTCEASGRFTSSDPLVALLYGLMRDHLPTGTVASLVYDAAHTNDGNPCEYTNGWLAQYAQHLSGMLRPSAAPVATEKPGDAPKPPPDSWGPCNCGDPECGGCYPSAHGGSEP